MNWIQSVSDDGLIQIIHHEHVNRASHLRAVRACRDFSVEPRKNSLEHSADTSKKINIDRMFPFANILYPRPKNREYLPVGFQRRTLGHAIWILDPFRSLRPTANVGFDSGL